MIRALPAIDRLDREGRTLLLFEEKFVELSPLGAAIWDFAAKPCAVDDVVAHLVDTFGSPGEGAVRAQVDEIVDRLEASGVLERIGVRP